MTSQMSCFVVKAGRQVTIDLNSISQSCDNYNQSRDHVYARYTQIILCHIVVISMLQNMYINVGVNLQYIYCIRYIVYSIM